MGVSRLLVSTGMATVVVAGMASAQSSTESYTYDALGRLIDAKTVGGQNGNEVHSICYDPSGNRTRYRSSSNGSSANCPTGAPTPAPSPTPTPTPPPTGNNPPVTKNDSVSGECYTSVTVNLTANDSDPEGNYPLTLTAVSSSRAVIVSASSVRVQFGPLRDSVAVTYTVKDSLGSASTGLLGISTLTCSRVEP